MSSSTKTAKSTKLSSSDLKNKKSRNVSELKQEETPELKQDLTIDSKKENTENTENISNISNKSPDDESSSSEDESDDDSDNEMFTGLSKEDINKMKQRMGIMQNGYNSHLEKEKTRQIKDTQHSIEFNLGITVNDEEAEFIIEFVEDNNYNLQEQLQDEGLPFLQSMKEMMEQSKLNTDNTNNNHNSTDYEWPDTNSDDEDDEDWVANEKRKKASRAAKRKNKNVGKMRNLDGSVRCGRLLLNDALKNTSSMEGWSEARQKAWKNRRSSPNAYFYRFNVPGQPQKNGKWTVAEHALFMKRVIEFGVNDQWGIFSKTIPGRVGYQCSNYWRGLVKDGDVSDPNYHYDGKKLHFKRNTKHFSIKSEYRKYAITVNRDASKVWRDLPQKHAKHPSEAYCNEVREALSGAVSEMNEKNKNKKQKKKKRKKMDDDDEDWDGKPVKRRRRNNGNDEAFHCNVSVNGGVVEDDNPIPDFIDIMTGTVVVKPAISPYGHVLGYDTWTKILRTSKHKNLCPFTLQKMTRRSLVKLTKANWNDFDGRITNITKEQTDLLASING